MKRLSLLWMLLLSSMSMTLFAQQTDIVSPTGGSYYYPQAFENSDEYGQNDLKMYVALKDKDGNRIGSDVLTDVYMAAYVDGVCRVYEQPTVKWIDCNNSALIYNLRLQYAPTGSKVKLRLLFPAKGDTEENLEYEFADEFTVEAGSQTIGTEPSDPYLLTFIPLESVGFAFDNPEAQLLSVGLNETKDIPLSFIPADHTPIVNYKMQYDFANSQDFINVDAEAGTITGLQQTDGVYLGMSMLNTKSNKPISNSFYSNELGGYTENTLVGNAMVQVTLAVQNIETSGEINIYPNDEVNLANYYQIIPSTASNQNVTAVIPDEGVAIAEVMPAETNEGWIVKGLAVGETYVTVTTQDGGKTVNIPIRVLQAVTSIEKPNNAPQGTVVVPVGTALDSSILPYNILPENASIKDIWYDITNTGTTVAVSMSQEPETMGLPVAIAAGTATVNIVSVENPELKISYEVKVVEPITGITLVAENQTIWTNENVSVYTTYNPTENWFSFTPDVEHFPTVTFTNEDGSALTGGEISAQTTTDAIKDTATTPGVYKMTITTNQGFNTSVGTEISKTITVTANQEVTNITGPNGEPSNANAPIEITVEVGEDITKDLVYVLTPDNATNKLVRYVESGDTSVVHTYNDDVRKVVAKQAGTVDIFIYPEGVPQNSSHMNLWYRVTVIDPVTAINALMTENIIYSNDNKIDQILEGEWFEFVPATTSQKDVTVTCSNSILEFFEVERSSSDDPVAFNISCLSHGETTVTITSNDNPNATCSIKVIVKAYPESFTTTTKELTVFLDEATDMPTWTATALNPIDKQPVAEEYIEFDESKLTFEVVSYNQDYSWHDPIVFSEDNSQFAGLIPGSYYVQAHYNDGDYSASSAQKELKIRVRTPLNMQSGWNWVAFSDEFAKYYSNEYALYLDGMMDNIVEIRSEDGDGIKDSEWGWFGDFNEESDMQMYQGYKIRLTEGTYEPFAWGKDIDGNLSDILMDDHMFEGLHEGWNWIGFNNFRPVDLSNYLSSEFAENTRIISQNGFAIHNGDGWVGDLETLEPATGYLLYLPAGASTEVWANGLMMMDPPVYEFGVEVNGPAATSKSREEIVWNYNMRQFANNMNIVAIGDGDVALNPEKYSFGAFVGDECRGEGKFNKGYWFITLNGNGGETVNFRLYNKETGEYTEVDNTVEFKMMAGTLSKPVTLNTRTRPTGIDATELAGGITILNNRIHFGAIVDGTANVYDMSGRVVASQPVADGDLSISELPHGTYIINVVADGAVVASKKVVK